MTMVFSDNAVTMTQARGGDKLSTLLDVINMTLEDAISDMMAVVCLEDKGFDWLQKDHCLIQVPQ